MNEFQISFGNDVMQQESFAIKQYYKKVRSPGQVNS
jgi:hypothetical protein